MTVPEPHPADPLADSHRIAAARRLLLEASGPAAFDRLSGLAARLLQVGHAKVTLFTDGDTVIGGYGLPPGVVGGPALLTGALSAITVGQASPLVVSDAAADDRVSDLPAVTSGQVAAYLGAPLIAASGMVVGVLAVYDAQPRTWSGDDGEVLSQLAASVVAELELSAAGSVIGESAARLDIALEAGRIGIWENDLRTGRMHWDDRTAAIFGLDGPQDLPGLDQTLMDRVHPDDHERVNRSMERAIAEGIEFDVEARSLHVDGSVRWTVSRGRAVRDARGDAVAVIGTVQDVTGIREEAQRRMAAVSRAAAMAELAAEASNATAVPQLAEIALRGATVLGASASALTVADATGQFRLHLNQSLVETVARTADVRLPAEGIVLPSDDDLPTGHVARTGERLLFADRDEAAARFPRLAAINDTLGTRALAALPLRVEGGLLGSFVVVWDTPHAFTDTDVELLEALTAQLALSVSRLQADAERASAVAATTAANRRLQLLADVGQALSGNLDIARQIARLAELVVPELGDWCWLVVTDEHGRMGELASAHHDPARAQELAEYVQVMVEVMTEDAAARIVTRTGRPLVLPRIDPARISAALPDPVAREALSRLDMASGAVVPLVARGRTLGALGLFNGAERGGHAPAEVEAAAEVGRRAGMALGAARLFAQQRDLAAALQRSLLTAPPDIAGAQVVVRYVPAAAGAEIGGDWYDAFGVSDETADDAPGRTTVLAIGDVVGHDRHAAAAMGQVRGLLRGISFASGCSPAEALTRLDRAMAGLVPGTLATAVMAQLVCGGSGGAVLRWSNAGHPPPVLLGPDGRARLLDFPGELLLGVDAEAHRTDHTVEMPARSMVLLHTDGLVERRGRDLDAGTAELLRVVEGAADLDLEALCDHVLAELFQPNAQDDVALLAVRLG